LDLSWFPLMVEGHNPMRWECGKDGCFNVKRRPKIEVFAECFPRRINFGDVDGLVELNGFFCLLEWKGDGGSIKTGQRISFEAFTRRMGNVVFVVEGDAETMHVDNCAKFWDGKFYPFQPASLPDVVSRIRAWADFIEAKK